MEVALKIREQKKIQRCLLLQLLHRQTGQTFTPGQTIQMSGNIIDDKFIAEVHIHVTNTNTGTLLMDVHLYPGMAVRQLLINQLLQQQVVNYKIQVIAKDRA